VLVRQANLDPLHSQPGRIENEAANRGTVDLREGGRRAEREEERGQCEVSRESLHAP
jgi:hypothetical protein